MTFVERVAFVEKDRFEADVSLALVGAGILGALGLAVPALSGSLGSELITFTLPAALVGFFATRSATRTDRLLMFALCGLTPFVAALLPLHALERCELSFAGVGLFSWLGRRGDALRGVGHPHVARWWLSMLVATAFGLLGMFVVQRFGSSLGVSPVFGAIAMALFLGLSLLVHHVFIQTDALQTELDAALRVGHDELFQALSKTDTTYKAVVELMKASPSSAPLTQTRAHVAAIVRDSIVVAHTWAELESNCTGAAKAELEEAIADLRASADASHDPEARAHLLTSVESLQDELERVEGLMLKRERVMAKLKANTAAIERVKVTLLTERASARRQQSLERLNRALGDIGSPPGASPSSARQAAAPPAADVEPVDEFDFVDALKPDARSTATADDTDPTANGARRPLRS